MKTLLACLIAAAVVSNVGATAQAAKDQWEKVDNSEIRISDESTGVSVPVGVITISMPLHGNIATPPILGHMSVTPLSGESLRLDVFYGGAAADFPNPGELDLHFQVNPPAGLPPTGLTIGELNTIGSFPSSGFEVSGLLISQWAGTHHFSMSSGGVGSKTFTSVTSSFNAAGSFFDVFADISVPSGSSVDPAQPLFSLTLSSQSVPEPSSVVLATFGLLGLAYWGQRRRRAA